MSDQPNRVVLPPESQPASMVLRGLLAILLTIGFYGLALVVAGVLLYIVYFQIFEVGRVNIRISLFAILGAVTILWAIMPRIDRFTAPGARLLPGKHPRLFEQIQSVAAKVGQKMPVEVYLVPDVNAFVTERGGLLGIGRKRVMGIGLPLLQSLTIQQLQAVLAHEFGHFYAGDTSLGPYIYKTRTAIIRTIVNLGDSLLQAPFRWYGDMFMRVTQSISRRQEYVADALSASVIGKQPAIDALKTVAGLAPAYNTYWQNEVLPIFNRGYRPPLASGFSQFVQQNNIIAGMGDVVNQELKSGKSGRYDSHPALNERIQAISALPVLSTSGDNRLAVSLVENLAELEETMLFTVFGKDKIAPLKPVTWEAVAETVYVKDWEQVVQQHKEAIPGFDPLQLPEVRKLPGALSSLIAGRAKQSMTSDTLQRAVDFVLSATCAHLLVQGGWKVITQPGCDFTFIKDGKELSPFHMIHKLAEGEINEGEWRQIWLDAGAADLCLLS